MNTKQAARVARGDYYFEACPYCPFCGAHGGPTLWDDPGGGQLNWACEECGEMWRMKRGGNPSSAEMQAHLHREIARARNG